MEARLFYVYSIRSKLNPDKHYVGSTDDLRCRIQDHNAGLSPHTRKYKPWVLVAYFAFEEKIKAKKFEKYLKTGSGRTFAKRHF